jgi:heat shock protein HspQ
MVRIDPQGSAPRREQPYYHLFAENEDGAYIAYVSQQNLLEDGETGPVDHPQLEQIFEDFDGLRYPLRHAMSH